MSTHQSSPSDKSGAKGSNHRRPLTYNPDAEIVRCTHAPLVTGLSDATIWRYRRAGKFPSAIRLGDNSVGFRRTDIDAWLEQRREKER